MNELSRYWQLVQLDATGGNGGYRVQPVSCAREFLQAQFSDLSGDLNDRNGCVQHQLLVQGIGAEEPGIDAADEVTAELCLRCYVSHPILWACQKRARIFGVGDRFTYQDLLPFVLTDDGSVPLGTYVPFSAEIVRSYRPGQGCNLSTWARLRVNRHPEVNQFLLECGLHLSSDWALLNRSRSSQLTGFDQTIVDVFHQVYRRDRIQLQNRQPRCLEPSVEQLQEMVGCLEQQGIAVHSSKDLLIQLKRIAANLRREEVWGRRGSPLTEPLEITLEGDEWVTWEIPDVTATVDPEEAERLELQAFCREQLLGCLQAGIRQSLRDRLTALKRRPKRAHLANHFLPALRSFYCDSKSQTEIAASLGIKEQYEISRLLDLKSLLSDVRRWTQETLLANLLQKAQQLELVSDPLPPDYLSHLIQAVESVIDEAVFRDAASEVRGSRHRVMNSLYAQQLRQVIQSSDFIE